MKKVFIIVFFVLLTFCVSAVILNKENLTTQQNKNPNSNTEDVAEDTDNTQEYVYIPIPEDKKAQYKAEIEAYIDENVPIAKQEMEKEVTNAKEAYKQFLDEDNMDISREEYLDKLNTCWDNANFSHAKIYLDLINITKKYVNIDNLIPATGFVQELDLFIMPYLENNNIKNTDKIIYLYKLSSWADGEIRHIIDLIPNY